MSGFWETLIGEGGKASLQDIRRLGGEVSETYDALCKRCKELKEKNKVMGQEISDDLYEGRISGRIAEQKRKVLDEEEARSQQDIVRLEERLFVLLKGNEFPQGMKREISPTGRGKPESQISSAGRDVGMEAS